jgi:hypothetical protein
MHSIDRFIPGPCPVCARPQGAFMGNSQWSWRGMACSDACGEAASAAVNKVRASREYKDEATRMRIAEQSMVQMEASAVKAALKRA